MTPAVDVVSTEASTRHQKHQNPQKNSDTFFNMLEKKASLDSKHAFEINL